MMPHALHPHMTYSDVSPSSHEQYVPQRNKPPDKEVHSDHSRVEVEIRSVEDQREEILVEGSRQPKAEKVQPILNPESLLRKSHQRVQANENAYAKFVGNSQIKRDKRRSRSKSPEKIKPKKYQSDSDTRPNIKVKEFYNGIRPSQNQHHIDSGQSEGGRYFEWKQCRPKNPEPKRPKAFANKGQMDRIVEEDNAETEERKPPNRNSYSLIPKNPRSIVGTNSFKNSFAVYLPQMYEREVSHYSDDHQLSVPTVYTLHDCGFFNNTISSYAFCAQQEYFNFEVGLLQGLFKSWNIQTYLSNLITNTCYVANSKQRKTRGDLTSKQAEIEEMREHRMTSVNYWSAGSRFIAAIFIGVFLSLSAIGFNFFLACLLGFVKTD